MGLYKIDKIEHSGSMGCKGTERVDGRYPLRKGSVVFLRNLPDVGARCFMDYMIDNQGHKKVGTLYTTEVTEVESSNCNKNLVIHTLNSVYYLSAYGRGNEEI